MIIKTAQIGQIEKKMKNDFACRIAAGLRADYAEDVEDYDDDDELLEDVAEGIRRAESYGLESDADVTAFVELLFTVGWYFDQYELFDHFLTSEEYLPEYRLDLLFEAATDADWEAAALIGEDEEEA